MGLNSFKRSLYLIAFIVLPLLSFANDQADALFAKANALYANGQKAADPKVAYQLALDLYKEVMIKGYQGPELYFNMGNANYKVGDLPSALLYYEKALKLSPNDEEIKANIRFVNTKINDKIEEVPEFFITEWWNNSVVLHYNLKTLSAWSLVFVLLGSALLIVYFFAHALMLKKSSFYGAVVLFALGIFTVFLGSRQVRYFENNRQAIVFSSTVTVKSEPSEASKSLFVIHDGTKVNLPGKGKNSDWIKVRLGNGNEGWMKVSDLKEI